jgi:hypothetical protein
MVGIVPGSAKLMELAGLCSGKARSLLGRGIGSLVAQDALVAPCRGNAYPSQVLGHGSLAPEPRVFGVVASRDPIFRGVPHASDFRKIQHSTISGLEVKQTFGYL